MLLDTRGGVKGLALPLEADYTHTNGRINLIDLCDDVYRPTLAYALNQCAKTRNPQCVSVKLNFRSHSSRHFEFQIAHLRNRGIFSQHQLIIQFESLKPEDSTRKDNKTKHFNDMVEQLCEGRIELDSKLNVVFASPKTERLLNKRLGREHQGSTLTHWLPELDLVMFATLLESAKAVGYSPPVEQHLQALSKWVSMQLFKQGEDFCLILRDLTQQKTESAGLTMLTRAIEEIRDLVVITNDLRSAKNSFKTLYVNRAFEQNMETRRERWLGRNPYSLIEGRVPTCDFRKILVAFLSRQKLSIKTKYLSKSGLYIPAEIMVSPFTSSTHAEACFLVMFRLCNED